MLLQFLKDYTTNPQLQDKIEVLTEHAIERAEYTIIRGKDRKGYAYYTPLIRTDIKTLDLGAKTLFPETLDISLLKYCYDLEKIDLSANRIKHIVLDGLEDNYTIETIILSNNELQSIKLPPIPNLKTLILKNNKLRTIDLKALAKCQKLEVLDLSGNFLEALDLSPLANCENLKKIILTNNLLKKLDVTPLEDIYSLETLAVDEKTQIQGTRNDHPFIIKS